MPRSCNICAHQESAEITKAILAGASNREVVRRFGPGITESGVQRHRRNCLKAPRREPKIAGERGAPADARGTVRFDSNAEIATPADLLDRLAVLFRVSDLFVEALDRRDSDAVAKLGRELRATIETFAKVKGWLVDGGVQVNVDQRRQGLLLLGRMDEDALRAAIARLAAGGDIAEIGQSNEAAIDVEHHILTP